MSGGHVCLLSPYTAVETYHHTASGMSSISLMSLLLLLFSFSLQIVAAILAIAGIVMMTYADGFHSHSVIGITFVVASASMSALYKVLASIPTFNKEHDYMNKIPYSDTFRQEGNDWVGVLSKKSWTGYPLL